MRRHLRLVLTLPPRVVVRRAAALLADRCRSVVRRRLDHVRSTRFDGEAGEPASLLPPIPAGLAEPHRPWILEAARRHRSGVFDLLGSGWVRVTHGMTAKGVGGRVYPPGPTVAADGDGVWLDDRLPPSVRAESRRLWSMVSAHHTSIDWHLDFKSGHRWAEDCWYKDIAIGRPPGADVKVPWELGRLHHLTTLAWARLLEPEAGWEKVFRDHVLDFLAANPPRFGVNWRCTMDVGIRAANLATSWSLFRAAGVAFDGEFTVVLARALVDHGRHIVANLEKYPEGRGNHYLANVCGLAFVAAALPGCRERRTWLEFARRELDAEITDQFLPDGANFEASTCYHRLSAEMVAMTAALLVGQGSTEADGWAGPIGGMAAFTLGITKPSGRVAQIGDNDSGRFLKLQPAYDADLVEDDLDHRHLVAAVGALLGRADLEAAAGPFDLDAWVVRGLAGRPLAPALFSCPPAYPRGPRPAVGNGRRFILRPGGSGLADGLECLAWPDFGYYVMRSGRLWLGIRCGSIGQNGRGGHAHNDQLSVEISIDGRDWVVDPGTWLYTPFPGERNRYRSVGAHFAPRRSGREPGDLGLGLFWLGNEANAVCLSFGTDGFLGRHDGYGRPVWREIRVEDEQVVITDRGEVDEGAELAVSSADDARKFLVPGAPPFSPGYGKRAGGGE